MCAGGFLYQISVWGKELAVLAHLGKAVAAIHRTIGLGLEGNLGLAAASCADCGEVLTGTLRSDTRLGGLLTMLVKNDVSAICMHTNLDAADGGVNDCLANKLGLNNVFLLNDEKIGRIGTLSCEKGLEEFLRDVIESLRCGGLRYRSGSGRVHRVAVGGGACGEYIPQAIAQGCDTFVTSDLRYNDFLDTQTLNLIDAGHFPTENVVCPAIAAYLKAHFPEVQTVISTSHRDVIQYYL